MSVQTVLRRAAPIVLAAAVAVACGVSSEDAPQPIEETARPDATATPNIDSTRMTTTGTPSPVTSSTVPSTTTTTTPPDSR